MANLLERILNWRNATPVEQVTAETEREVTADYVSNPSYSNLFSVSYNGEKNVGEIGPIKNYLMDYDGLRARAWQSFLESEVTQTVLNKFTLWVVASGLRLQAQPNQTVLKSEGIDIDVELFNEIVEARFSVWAKSKSADYSGMNNLVTIGQEAFKGSKTGGDMLVVLRTINKTLKVQIIDGVHLSSPLMSPTLPNGNVIKNGIETDPKGQHIAFYVKTGFNKFERIEAISKSSGLTTAFLVYGKRYRVDNNRGIPIVATVLETLAKLERYKEATVATAEEIAKVVYQIVHGTASTGENPFSKQLAKQLDLGNQTPVEINGKALADQVQSTTNKQAINMPIGAEIKSMNHGNGHADFKNFYQPNVELVCAAIGIPPNVAMSIYNDSFSASRAATKDWEHTILVNREDFSYQFYQKIYEYWLHLEILKFKIDAPGYLEAFYENNEMLLSAYRAARFTGPLFPHIDPMKEAKAERIKLGPLAENIPLTTIESATEALNSGESDSNMAQFSKELKYAKELKLETKEDAKVD